MKNFGASILTLTLLLAGCAASSQASGPNPSPQRRATGIPTHLSLQRRWSASVSPNADSAPAYLGHVHLRGGKTAAVVYVLAGNNGADCQPSDPVRSATLYAFAVANGRLLWRRSTGGPSRCTTAGPAALGRWVYAPGLDGAIHRYNAATGAESKGHGWPVRVTLMPYVEKVSATPTHGNGRLYVTTSGFTGDQGHYEGHLVSITLANAHTTVFNTLCSAIPHLLNGSDCGAVQSGLFGRGEGVIDPLTHDVYVVSGNGPWNGRTDWGDSLLKLDPSGRKLLDSYTPTDQAYLAESDLDLGSTGPALLPPFTAGKHPWHLLVQGGKGARCQGCGPVVLRLLNRDNLGGKHALGQLGGDLQDLPTPGGCDVLTAPAVWRSPSHQIWVFYSDSCGMAGYRLQASHGQPRLRRVWSSGTGGTTPALHGNVLYVAHDGAIVAYRPNTGAVLWQGGGIGPLHWEYPLVTAGHLFMTDDQGKVYAYTISARR